MDPENWAYYEHMYFSFSSYNPPKSEQLEALSSFVRVNIYFTDTNVLMTKVKFCIISGYQNNTFEPFRVAKD